MSSLGIFNPSPKTAYPLDRRLHGIGELSPTPQYTWKSGDTGTSVAKHFVDNGNRWPELVKANPTRKCASYGFCAYPGNVITLPASWVAAPAPAAAPSAAASTTATTAIQIPSSPSPEALVSAIAPSSPSVADQIAPTKTGMSTAMKIGIGAAAVALVGFAVYAKGTKKKAA